MAKYIMLTVFLVLIVFTCLCVFTPPEPIINAPIINVPIKPPEARVIFWRDGYLIKPILNTTGSHLTHAAIILDGFVYEAVPPRVRKITLAEYTKEMQAKSNTRPMQKRGFTWFIIKPKQPYTDKEVQAMIQYADSQLGRPYMIRGYGKRLTRGVFCSQLVGDILAYGGQIESSGFNESPGSLYKKLEPIYD